jgi:hypothetical protein
VNESQLTRPPTYPATSGLVQHLVHQRPELLTAKERSWARRVLRRVISLLAVALEDGDRIVVPATALAQVVRDPAKQLRLWRDDPAQWNRGGST